MTLFYSKNSNKDTNSTLFSASDKLDLIEIHTSLVLWAKNQNNCTENKQLSKREIDVLRWTADGKTSEEIAKIIGITKRTVDFHVSRSMQKLDAVNKTNAVIKATYFGILNYS